MLFPRILPFLALFLFVAAPAFAAEYSVFPESFPQAGKGKKGDAPPRPRPKPGPREGDDDD